MFINTILNAGGPLLSCPGWSPFELTFTLCQGLQNILGADMKIETEILGSIQLSKSGKFKWIISEVSGGFLEEGLREA